MLSNCNETNHGLFTVVDAGNGKIALHNTLHNRFLRLCRTGSDLKYVNGNGGTKDVSKLPDNWGAERFVKHEVIDGKVTKVALYNPSHGEYISWAKREFVTGHLGAAAMQPPMPAPKEWSLIFDVRR